MKTVFLILYPTFVSAWTLIGYHPLPSLTVRHKRTVYGLRMAVTRPPRPIPPPAGVNAQEIKVCTDPKRSCGARGGAEIVEIFRDVIRDEGREERVEVSECSCVGPCSLSVNVVAGWKDKKGKFQRAVIQREVESDPKAKMSRSARLKTKPGVYTSVTNRDDAITILNLLEEKTVAALESGSA